MEILVAENHHLTEYFSILLFIDGQMHYLQ